MCQGDGYVHLIVLFLILSQQMYIWLAEWLPVSFGRRNQEKGEVW